MCATHAGEGGRATRSGLLRDGDSLPVNFFEDRISAALEQGFADRFSQLYRVVAVTRLAQNLEAVRVGHDCFEMQPSVANLGKSADRYLASATEFVEQSSLASCGSTRCGVVQEREMLPRDRVSGANLNPQCTLPSSRAHYLRRDDLPDKLGFSEPVQTSRCQDDGIVLAGFQLAQTGVHISAQRVNVEVGTNGFQLRLAA